MYCLDYKLEKPIYAIVRYTNDLSYNENESFILIFETIEDYQKWIDNANEEQPYTGLTWKTLYKKYKKYKKTKPIEAFERIEKEWEQFKEEWEELFK